MTSKQTFSIAALVILLLVAVVSAKSLIDSRHAEALPNIRLILGDSPHFSPEEKAQEIPEGLTLMLVDKHGYGFDWDAYCNENPDCHDVFLAKKIRMIPVQPLFIESDPNGICTTDTDCQNKHGFDMDGTPVLTRTQEARMK
ncbi:MAG: hypothetical protein AB9866_21580 [Syntrophobacteraceae bacterium]